MSKSRLATLAGGLAAILMEIGNTFAGVGPPYSKYIHIAAAAGTLIAMFNERAHGGVSMLPVVPMSTVVAAEPTTPVVPVAVNELTIRNAVLPEETPSKGKE